MVNDERILVTGAGGFVGGHMLELLIKEGYSNIIATDLKRPENIPRGVKFRASDLCDRKSMDKVTKGVSAIFHIADLFDFFAPFEQLYAVNVEGTKNICEAALNNRVRRMIKFSSGAIYDAKENIKENDSLKPVDRYALTKLLGEIEVSKYHDLWTDSMAITILRPAVIYGRKSKYGAAQAFLTQAIGAKLMGTKILPGKGDKKACYVHVDDIVGAALHLYETGCYGDSMNINDMAINVSDDTGATPNEIADMIFANVKMNPVCKAVASMDSKLKLPKSLMVPTANLCEVIVKLAKKAGILKTKPSLILERGAIDYMFLPTHLTLDNSRLKDLGYKLKHPSSLESMPEVIRWYEETGWEIFKR